jgi:lysophospholipase L1-like esterase
MNYRQMLRHKCRTTRISGTLSVRIAANVAASVVVATSFVTVMASSAVYGGTPHISYVALGDSYSSGEGNPPFYDEACHTSSAAWPFDLANGEGFQPVTDLACSGATTSALTSKYRGQLPQLTALAKIEKDNLLTVVTVTMGGDNEHLFSTVLTDCYLRGIAHLNCNTAMTQAMTKIDNLAPVLEQSYKNIVAASQPGVHVLVVGYPNLFPVPPAPTVNCGWLHGDDDQGLVNLATDMDSMVAAAASAAGVTYASTLNAFQGHELCTSQPWVNPIEGGGSGNAHPNASGQQAIANTVELDCTFLGPSCY